MFNQIRAEFYKLFHTKALYLTFALILAVFGIFSISGQQQFVVSSSSVDETWKIGETVGFLARAYSDQVHPMIEEIIRTATSYTVFFWLIVLIFSVVFFSREYTDSTRKMGLEAQKNVPTSYPHPFYKALQNRNILVPKGKSHPKRKKKQECFGVSEILPTFASANER